MTRLKTRLHMAQVASCQCGIKSPKWSAHRENCLYRILSETEEELDRLQTYAMGKSTASSRVLQRQLDEEKLSKHRWMTGLLILLAVALGLAAYFHGRARYLSKNCIIDSGPVQILDEQSPVVP